MAGYRQIKRKKTMPFQSFRLSMRFILPLAVVLGLFGYAVVPLRRVA
jgi:hypothetical protein